MADAGIISDPKSFAVGKRHLIQQLLATLSLTSPPWLLMIHVKSKILGYLKRLRSISFLKRYTPIEAMYGFSSASCLESPKTVVSTAYIMHKLSTMLKPES